MDTVDPVTKPENKDEGPPDDPMACTRRATEFTSENYKMELSNLPRHCKYQIVLELFKRRAKIKPHKIRLGTDNAYIGFKTTIERDEAIEKLNNINFKGKVLKACVAQARDDPLAKKRFQRSPIVKDEPGPKDEDTPITDDDINSQICPLWNKDYDTQIGYMDNFIRSILNMHKEIRKLSPNLKRDAPSLYEWNEKNSKISCQFDGVERSPDLEGYRNKCEFSIGLDGTVGFKLGRYKDGSERVCRPPKNCPIVHGTMTIILDSFEKYLKEATNLKAFDHVTHDGHYRMLTIRRNLNDECMVIIDMHPQNLSKEELDREAESLVSLLKNIKQVVSIYFNISEKNFMAKLEQPLRLVYGQDYLYEQMTIDPEKALNFRIGPKSFFQVNTRAAELLYKSIIEVAQLNSNSMVLDVGCGTGTIGLSLARRVSHVIGIEIVDSAVEDAKMNARENQIDNVTYLTGRAEDLIGQAISDLKTRLKDTNGQGEIVAIVDPPRMGFNNSFIKILRASSIQKIIYIACDPKANTNIISLCRPASKAYQGDPFVPTRAKAFDLFPHTKFCELLLVYERLSSSTQAS